MSTQSRIQAVRENLPPSMRRVADAILEDPQQILQGTISDLATACSTSETTVVRLCHRLELSGFSQLRLALAGELASERVRGLEIGTTRGAALSPDSALAQIVANIALTETLGIEETAAALDLTALHRAVEVIGAASTVLLHGISGSASTTGDLERKLQRIGRSAHALGDTHDALAAAALLNDSEVALGVSHSGATREVVAFLARARSAGATTIVITNARDGPVIAQADIILRTAVRESEFRSGALASRSAQLLIVDCLFVGLAQTSRAASAGALRRADTALEEYKST